MMSATSQWPLTHDAIRAILPQFILSELINNPISSDCYPLAMGYYPRATGHSMQRKQHDDNLLIYCTAGSGHIETDQFSGPVNKGDILLLPANQAHFYQASKQTPWTIYWLHFEGSSCEQLINHIGYKKEQPIISLKMNAQLITDFKRILSAHFTGYNSAAYLHSAATVRQILCYLALERNNIKGLIHDSFNLHAIQGFMQQQLNQTLDLDTLANTFNFSKYHFCNKYKKLTGQSPIQHFIHMKMERACYLLDSTTAHVSTISDQLGYDDPLYFSRIFRKIIGLSPAKYRLSGRG